MKAKEKAKARNKDKGKDKDEAKAKSKKKTKAKGKLKAELKTKPKKASLPAQPKGKLYGQVAIEENRLERFENRTRVRKYTIEFTCPEFTCVCPRSGFPDFATIYIKYVPDNWCVELKSLKLYINSFRDKHVFHEDVTNVILQDLLDLLDPHEIKVIGEFTVRGNIKTVITADHKK